MAGDGRFDEFSEQECAYIALGLTLTLIDHVTGTVSGRIAPTGALREFVNVGLAMFDEIGERMDIGQLDPTMMAALRWKLENEEEGGKP